jgi:LPS export ABC transporter protein LptC
MLALLLAVALLSACNEGGGVKPSAVVAATDSADQVLYGFVHFLTRDGVREGHVEADTAYFYDPTQTTVLRNMKIVFIDSAGSENATITARKGTYKWQSGDMTADSNVVMRARDGRVLKTEELFYDGAKKQLSSKVYFTFDQNADHLEGDGFVSDMKFEHIVVSGPRGKTGEGVVMPGQEPEDSK